MKIYIGSDHAGFELKEKLKHYLIHLEHHVEDMGAFVYDRNDDYPDFVEPVARAVVSNLDSMGIVLGGSGQGEAMCANRVDGARAAVFYGGIAPKQEIDINGRTSTDSHEILKLTRHHNNANILSLGARFFTEEEAKYAVKIFYETPFSNEERNIRRIENI